LRSRSTWRAHSITVSNSPAAHSEVRQVRHSLLLECFDRYGACSASIRAVRVKAVTAVSGLAPADTSAPTDDGTRHKAAHP
jgi:hypothetical protein